MRPKRSSVALYGFADASGQGFGSTFALPNGDVMYRYGVWGRDADNTSSNYRELRNLVESLEDAYQDTRLQNCEIFLFTDNSTAEGAYYKGNSPSRLLFELVLRLRQLEMHSNLLLHVTHVTGSRMINQGTDGLSRGLFAGGILMDQNMLSYIPLHQAALDRSTTLCAWITEWWPCTPLIPLTPADWYERGHGLQGGSYDASGVWLPQENSEQWYLCCCLHCPARNGHFPTQTPSSGSCLHLSPVVDSAVAKTPTCYRGCGVGAPGRLPPLLALMYA